MKKILKKVLISIGFRLKVCWWFLLRPTTRGAKCVILRDNQVLLVRPAYGHKMWMIPGGGVKRSEMFEAGAHRELKEETGIETSLTYFCEYEQEREYKHDTVQCFYGFVSKAEVTIDNFEIVASGWFDLNSLPSDCSPSVARILSQYQMTAI